MLRYIIPLYTMRSFEARAEMMAHYSFNARGTAWAVGGLLAGAGLFIALAEISTSGVISDSGDSGAVATAAPPQHVGMTVEQFHKITAPPAGTIPKGVTQVRDAYFSPSPGSIQGAVLPEGQSRFFNDGNFAAEVPD